MSVDEFVRTYTASGLPRICFDCNGKHADEFVDANMEFRQEVVTFVINKPELASPELLRDLLLERGDVGMALPILEAWMQSFDTSCATGSVNLARALARRYAEHCRSAVETCDGQDKALFESGVTYFEDLADQIHADRYGFVVVVEPMIPEKARRQFGAWLSARPQVRDRLTDEDVALDIMCGRGRPSLHRYRV